MSGGLQAVAADGGERKELDITQAAAQPLGFAVRHFPVRTAGELDVGLADIGRARGDAIVAFAEGSTLALAGRIAQFAQQSRIPAVDGWAPFAQAGNLMIHGPVIDDVYRRPGACGPGDRVIARRRPPPFPAARPAALARGPGAGAAHAPRIGVPDESMSA